MKKLFFLLLISLLISSCEKDDDLLAPPITRENTFSCKINGKIFIAQDHGGFTARDYGISLKITESKWLLMLADGKNDLYMNLNSTESDRQKKIKKSDGDTDFTNEVKNVME